VRSSSTTLPFRAGYTAVDVGSLNGTYLNGGRIERAVLHHGDELQIGKFHLMFLEGRA
jgi:pSer/pThr/pTyr-binding forkhead associated (FHA) protein